MQVSIGLLGGLRVDVDGRAIPDAALGRRDVRRVLARLALAPGRRMHRELLIDALWPEVDLRVGANRLHKASHFLRKATGDPTAIVADGRSVALFPGAEVVVDVDAFAAAAAVALASADASTDAVARALDLWGGELLPLDPYEEWTVAIRQRLARRHRELLRLAGRHADIVALDPTDEAAHLALMRASLAAGDRTGVLRQFESLRQALEDGLGIGPSAEAVELRDSASTAGTEGAPAREGAPRFASLATQTVHRCTMPDGVRLAYATSGSGPPLVKVGNWLSHLDYDWSSPVWRHWWQALSRDHTLVRYDERGCGLSQRDVDDDSFALDAWVRDLEVVVDSLGLDRFPLLGISQGGPIAVTYAARHPERVSHLVVYGTCARSTWEHADDDRRRELRALDALIGVSWGSDQPGFRQVYDARFLPDGPIELWRAFDDLQRRSTSAHNAQRFWRAFGFLDCREAARALDVPTLILHSRHDQVWELEEAQELHAMVRGSRLVVLESRNHILQADEPAFVTFLDELAAFLARHP